MKNHPIKNLLFLDIETVPAFANYDQLSDRLKEQWDKKAERIAREEEYEPGELYTEKAGIYAEFGKIVVISVGFFTEDEEGEFIFRVKAYADHDEKKLLMDFNKMLYRLNPNETFLVAHNGKEFDYPYLCRRMLINGVGLPAILDIAGKKPWEIRHLDTMEMWKFGDFKSYTSLDLLAAVFDVPSSKSDIDGSMVGVVYHRDGDLDRIAQYCCQDVVVTAQVFQKMKGMEPVVGEQVIYV